jgi:hypothetical protein
MREEAAGPCGTQRPTSEGIGSLWCIMLPSCARSESRWLGRDARTGRISELPPSLGLVGLQDVDGFGESSGLPGAAAGFAQD